MKTFKSARDMDQLATDDPAYAPMKELVDLLIVACTTADRPYDYANDGYLVLIEEGDEDRVLELPELQCRLLDVPWEGAGMWHGNFFNAIYLANNEFGISFLIPDAPWVRGELRALLDELVSY